MSARIKFRVFFKIAKIAKFSKNKAYVNHQNRSLQDLFAFDAKSKLKVFLSRVEGRGFHVEGEGAIFFSKVFFLEKVIIDAINVI